MWFSFIPALLSGAYFYGALEIPDLKAAFNTLGVFHAVIAAFMVFLSLNQKDNG